MFHTDILIAISQNIYLAGKVYEINFLYMWFGNKIVSLLLCYIKTTMAKK